MNKFLCLFIPSMLILLACSGRSSTAGSNSFSLEAAPEGPFIELSEKRISDVGADTIAFGRVRQGEKVVRDLAIKNTDSKPMVITSVDLTCGCVELDYPRKPIKPGESGEITVKFDSKGISGRAYKTVLVQTSLSSKPHLLVVTATVE